MKYLIYFTLTFLIVYLISYFLLVRKRDKYDENRIPMEVEYLVRKYNLDLKRVNYKKFLNLVSFVGSIDMAIAVIIIFPIENIFLQLFLGFILLLPLIMISFRIVGKYYIKKGYVKNERNAKNRK